MRKPWVTLCIPTNRSLADSRASLLSAIDFAQSRRFQVVISDNSGDAEKAAYFTGLSPEFVDYFAQGPQSGAANMLHALMHAKTEFVLPFGDDDFILANADQPEFDFSRIGPDHVAVKPHIEVFSNANGLLRRNQYPIISGDGASRMLEYSRSAQGDNSSYYSFIRRSVFLSLYKLYVESHPTKAVNSDWPLFFAIVAAGKFAIDPATCYRYNIGKWEFADGIAAAVKAILTGAGLPAQATSYVKLFHFLDAYVYLRRLASMMTPVDQVKAAETAAILFLRDFLRSAHHNPDNCRHGRQFIAVLITAMSSGKPDMPRIFMLASNVAEALKPGLKSGYEAFLAAASRQGEI